MTKNRRRILACLTYNSCFRKMENQARPWIKLMPYDRNISGDILEIQDLQDNHASFTFLRHEISRIELNLVDGKDDDTEENL